MRSFKKLPAALLLLAVLCGGAAANDYKQFTVEEMVPLVEKNIAEAEGSLLGGAAAVEALLKSPKTDASQMTGKWNELVEQVFNGPAIKELAVSSANLLAALENARMDPAQSSVKGQDLTVGRSVYQEAEELAGFAREIQSVGEAVAWTLRVNRHIESLEKDIDSAPVRVGAYVEEMRAMSASLDIILRQGRKVFDELLKGQATPAGARVEFSRYLSDIVVIKAKTQNAAVSLINTSKYLEFDGSWVIPATELKRMEVLAEYWKDAANLYPTIGREITAAAARWAPLPKASWNSYLESGKEFAEVYGPLIKGDLFKGIRHFEGKNYADLPMVVFEAETTVRTVLSAVVEAEKDMDRRRRALEDDADLTSKELREIKQLETEYGPERKKALYRAGMTANRWGDRMAYLALYMEQLEKSGAKFTPQYEKAKKDFDDLANDKHPEQAAAKKAWQEFLQKQKEAQKRIDEIAAEHARRKKGLGLEPVIKGGKL